MFKHTIYTQCSISAGLMNWWGKSGIKCYNLNDSSTMYEVTLMRRYNHDTLLWVLSEWGIDYEDVITEEI
ncbi:hypothetical protein UAB78_007 [Escherichia phage UAB_Phi78]|uniref:Uncharacterized protein n=1 Tax=Escherichia phage UAB_Phi78 TaxID=979726 RepID=A0A9K0IG91_9CAUD|nr:hypothetical protein I132_gp07 [Escherichia phage UAB_Phi78]ADW95209.1 hypothetical protein UAB78_007 [Escherichia phage UAB_Phi78]